jgi:3-dehydroquinate synthase
MDPILITAAGKTLSEILVVNEALDSAETILPPSSQRQQVAILTQPGSAPYANRVAQTLHDTGLTVTVRVVPDRDASKTLQVAEECFLWLNDLALTRQDTVIGIGGGAVTDLAGFVAAVYLRGVEAVQVPTTLLAAVDAAVGGKTGVNVGGKNLAGVFRHPARVVVDLSVLASLPVALVREGAAEALKAGLIADPALVALYERHGLEAPMGEVVRRALSVKAAVVAEDFTEAGVRAILNYGHTVGHAVETAAGIPHGHAVAIGMVAAGAVAAEMVGFDAQDRQRAAIEKLGLPVTAPPVDGAEVRRLMALDKKRDAGGLRMVLLERIGVAVIRPVAAASVEPALAAVGIG